MPLKKSGDTLLTTMLGVKFVMENERGGEVACRADQEMLRYRFGSFNRASDLDAFTLHRAEIEHAASKKYDTGTIESHSDATVVVRTEDFASSLSRKLGRA